MTLPDISDDMLHAFVDGQLNDGDQKLVEAYLAANPEHLEQVTAWAGQNDDIRALFPAPHTRIELPQNPPLRPANANRTPWRAIAASVVLLAIGAALGWSGRSYIQTNTDIVVAGLVQDAMAAHAVFTADANRPVELRANQEDLLVNWLSNRIGKQLAAPDLSANGFNLVGGRLLSISDGPAAQFMYENADGARITLFAARGDGTQMAEFNYEQDGATGSFAWSDENLRFAVIGDLPREQLNAIAITIYQAFS